MSNVSRNNLHLDNPQNGDYDEVEESVNISEESEKNRVDRGNADDFRVEEEETENEIEEFLISVYEFDDDDEEKEI